MLIGPPSLGRLVPVLGGAAMLVLGLIGPAVPLGTPMFPLQELPSSPSRYGLDSLGPIPSEMEVAADSVDLTPSRTITYLAGHIAKGSEERIFVSTKHHDLYSSDYLRIFPSSAVIKSESAPKYKFIKSIDEELFLYNGNMSEKYSVDLIYDPEIPLSDTLWCPDISSTVAASINVSEEPARNDGARTDMTLPEVTVSAPMLDCRLLRRTKAYEFRSDLRVLMRNSLYIWTKTDQHGAFAGAEFAYSLGEYFSIGGDIQRISTDIEEYQTNDMDKFGRFHADRFLASKYSEGLLFVYHLTDYSAIVSQLRYSAGGEAVLAIVCLQQVF